MHPALLEYLFLELKEHVAQLIEMYPDDDHYDEYAEYHFKKTKSIISMIEKSMIQPQPEGSVLIG